MPHELHDRVSLEIARRVARGLRDHPEWVELGRSNLQRWARLNYDAPGLLRCYREWEKILEGSIDEIAAVLTAETEEGQRLRTTSPFAGALSPAEIWQIKRQVHDTSAA